MSESKRRQHINKLASELTKDLTDKGKLIEAGFAIFAKMVIPKDAPAIQFIEMQTAFMAGAEHVWTSVMNILDPGDEPTADDLRRMDLIQLELDEWRKMMRARMNEGKH